MSNAQYTVTIKNGETINETGVFFPGTPFQISQGETIIDVIFEPKNQPDVVYKLKHNNKEILQLAHNDYVPKCPLAEVSSAIGVPNPWFIMAAFVFLKITPEKAFIKYLDEHHQADKNYTITQAFFY